MNDVLFALWFFLPAGVSNASPVFINKIPWLARFKTPLDFGKTWRGAPIFGPNKTWRGLVSGTLAGAVTAGVFQQLLYDNSAWIRSISGGINYSSWTTVCMGAALGFGALLGDAVESFFKRSAGVKPGHSWFPFDQTDYIVGGLLFSFPLVDLPTHMYWLILLIWAGIHLIASYLGYRVGLKDKAI